MTLSNMILDTSSYYRASTYRIAVLIGGLLLGACSSLEQAKAPTGHKPEKPEQTETIHYASFEPDTLFDIIIAEMAGKRNRLDVTLGNYIKQAHETRDSGIVARAAHIAKYMNASQAALDATRLWLSLEPDNVEALQIMTLYLVRTGEFEQALPYIDRLLAQDAQTNLDFLVRHSRNSSEQIRNQMIESLQKLLHKYPKNTQLWFTQALLELQNSNIDQALKNINTSLTLEPDYLPAIMVKSDLLAMQGQPKAARNLLKNAVKKNPDHKRLGIVYARTLIQQGQLEEAQKQFTRLLEQNPQDSDLILSLALVSWENKLPETAKNYLNELILQGKKTEEAHTYLAQIAVSEEKFDQAIKHYRKIPPGPRFASAQIQIATIYAEKKNDMKQARATLNGARNLEPQQAIPFYLSETELLIRNKQFDEAFNLFEAALEEFPDHPDLLYSRAMLAAQQNQLPLMERDLRKILTTTPDSAPALNALGYTLADRTDRLEEALDLIKKALALEPNDPAIIDSLGWVYYKMGDNKLALQYLQKAYSLLKDHEIAAHLGEVLWVSGYPDQAKRIWQDSLKQFPDSELLSEVMARFLNVPAQ